MDEISAAQAAALTGFSERTIRRKIAAGELPARRIAPNRFGINVRDLPRRRDVSDLASRLAALEQRVTLLEEGQRALPLALLRAAAPPEDAGAILAGGEDSAVSPAVLSQLLIQLVREVERLGPLLAPGAPEAPDVQNGPEATDQPDDGRRRAAGRSARPRIGDAAG